MNDDYRLIEIPFSVRNAIQSFLDNAPVVDLYKYIDFHCSVKIKDGNGDVAFSCQFPLKQVILD